MDRDEVVDVVGFDVFANGRKVDNLRNAVFHAVVIDAVQCAGEHHFCCSVVDEVVVELQSFAEVGVCFIETGRVAKGVVDGDQVAVAGSPSAMAGIDINSGFVEGFVFSRKSYGR